VDSAAWDERYSNAELLWSATPNRWVEEIAVHLPTGRVLDLGAGEGRNSLWLVERGWTATAVDFSTVALERIKTLAEKRFGGNADRLTAVHADLLDYTPPLRSFDLVLIAYVQLVAELRKRVFRAAARAVAPGGHLLVIGHDVSNFTDGVGGPRDPRVLYTALDVEQDLSGSELVVTRSEAAVRPVDVDGTQRYAIDALLMAYHP
jgi:SAM-dependent methyltransferase